MRRVVRIPHIGHVGFPDQMSDDEVAQAVQTLQGGANPNGAQPQGDPGSDPQQVPQQDPQQQDPGQDPQQGGSDWVLVETPDGQQWEIHPEDLEKAKQKEPGLKVLSGPSSAQTDAGPEEQTQQATQGQPQPQQGQVASSSQPPQ